MTDYEALAKDYDRRYEQNLYGGVEKALVDFAAGARRVLEVGCGTGHWLGVLSKLGYEVTGVDASPGMLARARERLPGARLEHGRAEALPLESASFDRVYCINALHHFSDKAVFFREARRVLAPGGRVTTIGLDPHASGDKWCVYDYWEETLPNDRARYAACASIRAWMGAAGFSEASSEVVQHLPLSLDAREALDTGKLDKGTTSQLANLDDAAYARGVAKLRAAIAAAEARGATLKVDADLRLWGTTAKIALLAALACCASACSYTTVDANVPAAPPYQGGDGIAVTMKPENYDEQPVLQQSAPGADSTWQRVCQAPCNVNVDPRGRYRIAGGTITTVSEVVDADGYGLGTYTMSTQPVRESSAFALDVRSQRQTLHVTGASPGTRTMGWVFIGASAAYFVPAVLAFTGAFSHDDSFNDIFRWSFGLPMAAAGIAFFSVGLWLVMKHTAVTDDTGQTLAQSPMQLPAGLKLGRDGLVF